MQKYPGRLAGLISVLVAVVIALVARAGDDTAASVRPATTDWPAWRGAAQDGRSGDQKAPTKWSRTENVLWKTPVPGQGHSSPIVYGDRVFLTTADEATKKQSVLAFDRKTGTSIWSTLAHEGPFPRKNPKNSHASATLACDGKRVYGVFLNDRSLDALATDLDGRILWQSKVGDFSSEHGYGSSPVLYRSLLIVNGDSLKDSFIAALDTNTGKIAWRTERPATGRHGSYATPVVATLAGKPQVILTGMNETTSYDPETGKRLWSVRGPAEVTGCTPAWSESLVFASGGFPEKQLLAIRPNGQGDVTESHIAWRTGKGITYVPSPLYHAGNLYVVADGGVISCFEAATGKQIWQDRLQGAFTASLVLAGDLLYATNEAGKTFILKTGPKFEVVATNDLGEGALATPTICGGQIFLRTDRHLWCFGDPARSQKSD